jgi:NAD(P)-dependent dehydrogenase (short-subunit alcohol dehydrogenase family)
MTDDLGGVLVTGGASGLGAAVAAAVEAAGGRPIVLDRNPPADPSIDHVVVDLVDHRASERTTQAVMAENPDVRAVVTAAGIDACGRLEEVAAEDWERVVDVNLLGTVSVVRAALPCLEDRGGRVVTVASTLGLRALSDASAYCASKFGVVGFTRAMAVELAGRVGVTCLIPGGMETPFFDGRPEQYKPGPDAQLNDPSEVAAAAIFALTRPRGVEVRELLICPSGESSWP